MSLRDVFKPRHFVEITEKNLGAGPGGLLKTPVLFGWQDSNELQNSFKKIEHEFFCIDSSY